MKPLSDSILKSKWKEYREFLQRKSVGISTGISIIDDYLLGLGGMVNIQGETSSCKSVLGLQIAHHNLRKGIPCLMVDKENGDGRVITRMLCQANRVSDKQLKHATDAEKQQYKATVDDLPIHLHTEPIFKLEELAERIEDVWNEYQRPFIVLFDSIQAADFVSDDPRINLERWVYFLDRLKVEYAGKLTVIIISEKNRVSYGQQGTGGGKGSNVVDYKPETILDIKWNEADDTFTVKVSKHRDGVKGAAFVLKKVFSDPNNNRSFCFLLEAAAIEGECVI
jgi:KaiC/GvpD/RAD55 family RecA-like ATPase